LASLLEVNLVAVVVAWKAHGSPDHTKRPIPMPKSFEICQPNESKSTCNQSLLLRIQNHALRWLFRGHNNDDNNNNNEGVTILILYVQINLDRPNVDQFHWLCIEMRWSGFVVGSWFDWGLGVRGAEWLSVLGTRCLWETRFSRLIQSLRACLLLTCLIQKCKIDHKLHKRPGSKACFRLERAPLDQQFQHHANERTSTWLVAAVASFGTVPTMFVATNRPAKPELWQLRPSLGWVEIVFVGIGPRI